MHIQGKAKRLRHPVRCLVFLHALLRLSNSALRSLMLRGAAIVHYEYLALAQKTSVLRKAML